MRISSASPKPTESLRLLLQKVNNNICFLKTCMRPGQCGQGAERHPVHRERSPVRFPGRAHAQVMGSIPRRGCAGGSQPVFLSLSLSKINKNALKKIKTYMYFPHTHANYSPFAPTQATPAPSTFPLGSDWVRHVVCRSTSHSSQHGSGPPRLPADGPAWAPLHPSGPGRISRLLLLATRGPGYWHPYWVPESCPPLQTVLSGSSLQKGLGGCLPPEPGPYTRDSPLFGTLPVQHREVPDCTA